ncbi:MAG: glycosyl hydrolase [Anaerolineae bacterium]
MPRLYTLRQRLGVGGGLRSAGPEDAAQLSFGWYLDWTVRPDAFRSSTVEYVPMIRLHGGEVSPAGQQLLAAVDALPGALWLIGNEPDVKWQDNVTAEAYAEIYHDLYYLLKERDPTCRVAIGGVSQPTPLRLRYLDRILDAYQARYGEPMPVDVWNVHNFILREERDSWGVDIPPGMDERTGRLYEITDHDDLAIFQQQIVDFRRWMAARGQQDKPLIVTEYGILMPGEYGFPPAGVRRFMLGTFDFFRTAADPNLGYPADGYRLVQRWCWFSLLDERYPTGNLLRLDGGGLSPLGEAFAAYSDSSP